jgi:hypothetical protein
LAALEVVVAVEGTAFADVTVPVAAAVLIATLMTALIAASFVASLVAVFVAAMIAAQVLSPGGLCIKSVVVEAAAF